MCRASSFLLLKLPHESVQFLLSSFPIDEAAGYEKYCWSYIQFITFPIPSLTWNMRLAAVGYLKVIANTSWKLIDRGNYFIPNFY